MLVINGIYQPDKSKDIKEEQPENIDSILVKKFDLISFIFIEVNELQSLKKLFIFVHLSNLKFDKSIDNNDEHPENIEFSLVGFNLLGNLISFNEVQSLKK